MSDRPGHVRPDTGGVPDQLVLPSPVLVRCRGGHFEAADHQGAVRVSLTAIELSALLRFQVGCRPDQAYQSHREEAGPLALDRAAFDEAARRAVAGQLLLPFDPTHLADDRQAHQADAMRESIRRKAMVHAAFDRLEGESGEPGADGRLPVFGVHTNWTSAPASLGMILAYARAFDDGALRRAYDFRPRLAFDADRLACGGPEARCLPVLELHLELRREPATCPPRSSRRTRPASPSTAVPTRPSSRPT